MPECGCDYMLLWIIYLLNNLLWVIGRDKRRMANKIFTVILILALCIRPFMYFLHTYHAVVHVLTTGQDSSQFTQLIELPSNISSSKQNVRLMRLTMFISLQEVMLSRYFPLYHVRLADGNEVERGGLGKIPTFFQTMQNYK